MRLKNKEKFVRGLWDLKTKKKNRSPLRLKNKEKFTRVPGTLKVKLNLRGSFPLKLNRKRLLMLGFDSNLQKFFVTLKVKYNLLEPFKTLNCRINSKSPLRLKSKEKYARII
jgi:hypothetical protein